MGSSFLVSAACGILFFLALRTVSQARNRWSPTSGSSESEFWKNLAENLFHRNSKKNDIPEVRIERLLRTTSERLGLRHGFLFLHNGDRCRLLSRAISGYSTHAPLHPGEVVDRKKIYCGLLSEKRPVIAIDVASLSEWRRHKACVELGWEAYIGAHIALGNGLSASIAFTDSRPRDKLFSRSEREFVRQLGTWIGQMLENEVAAVDAHEAVSQFVDVS